MLNKDKYIKSHLSCPICDARLRYDGHSRLECEHCGYVKGGADHIHFVTDRIAVGNESVTSDDILLELLGIKTVMTVCDDKIFTLSSTFTHIEYPLCDSCNAEIDIFIRATACLGLLNQLSADRVLVHCMGGGRRSPAIVAYMLSDGKRKGFWRIIHRLRRIRHAVQLDGGIYEMVKTILK